MPRIAVIHKERCFPEKCGNLCEKLCPINREGSDCITISGKAAIAEELCTGCGICPTRCPFGAIDIINLPAELDKQPIHRYGENGFVLFSLPRPIPGKVVGVIGRNGIGKSTAIKILAGVEKPNLGNTEDPVVSEKGAAHEDVIKYFKGTELQGYFERLKDGKEKVAYKPQHVELIAKTSTGKVRDLLEKVDEKSGLADVAQKLELTGVLDRDIKQLSGGELQRVAIAATVLKKATLYIFDEPTSYLDIKQRLKVSQFIQSLCVDEEGKPNETCVMVIEHDLIALDYMADLMHIMYGKEACYGIVSNPRAAKSGINSYLEGYLKEENVRFRDKKISFDVRAAQKALKLNIASTWNGFTKKLGEFSLEADAGDIKQAEIVGVLGENGIGKTTFVKVMAGVEKPDTGEVLKGNVSEGDLKVSYKPQYLDAESEETVANTILAAVSDFNNELIVPLELEHLLEKKICNLSGGELQRVAIAHALSQQCELILLDEPSAYLDVEQRLKVSKVIATIANQRNIAIVVVDHDLLFIDYLSERLIVFDGKPAVSGHAKGPFTMEEGMNTLLERLAITLRRDEFSHRPRINKDGSQKDREQKRMGKYYYV